MLNIGVKNVSIDTAQRLEQAEVTVILLAISSGPTTFQQTQMATTQAYKHLISVAGSSGEYFL